MALTTTEFSKVFQRDLTQEAAVSNTGSKNVRNGPCTLRSISLVNSNANHAYASFKAYDHDGEGWVAGTTQPDLVIPCADNDTIEVDIAEGLDLEDGLTMAASQTDGTALTAAPAGDVTGFFVTS